MKSYILLLGLLLGGFTAYADSTAKKETEAILIGHVVDSRSGEHLPFITITVKGTTIGTTTDVSGHYLLGNLPVGRPLTVVAQSVGYKSAERSVTLGAHSTTELNFELEEQAVDVGEVVVEIDRNSVIRKETPSLVNILNSKLFERTNAATLADGLSFQPGVRVEDGCQNCGFAQVRINGLDGHYSQILARLAAALLGPQRRLRSRTDSRQHDRARGGDPRRRIGALRRVGHRRHDQHHHQGS